MGTLGRNAITPIGEVRFKKLATCLALIVGIGAKIDAPSLKELKKRIQGVIDLKGGIEILQFSGGEPTLHPQFFELMEWVLAHKKIDYLLLNTNGMRFANDEAFAEQLERTCLYGKTQIYLQFDGVQGV
jgi:hypothetical protein